MINMLSFIIKYLNSIFHIHGSWPLALVLLILCRTVNKENWKIHFSLEHGSKRMADLCQNPPLKLRNIEYALVKRQSLTWSDIYLNYEQKGKHELMGMVWHDTTAAGKCRCRGRPTWPPSSPASPTSPRNPSGPSPPQRRMSSPCTWHLS